MNIIFHKHYLWSVSHFNDKIILVLETTHPDKQGLFNKSWQITQFADYAVVTD